MTKVELEKRTKVFALWVIRFIVKLPQNNCSRVLGTQLLRSATSIGANYREATRAESRKDFVHKIAVIEKEAAESLYWIELCEESMTGDRNELRQLYRECNQLVAIFTRIGRTSKRTAPKSEIRNPKSEIPQ